MKEVHFDEDGNPTEIVEVGEGVRVEPKGGTVHVYLHLQAQEPQEVQKEDSSGVFWWVVAGFVLAWLVMK